MRVFLSFSGARGRTVAEVLGPWLRQLINAAEPWVSSDIEKGARWLKELTEALESTRFGIICLTSDSLTAPWILFEAGALSKTSDAPVCTFLLDIAAEDLEHPLAQFQAAVATKDDTRRLVHSIRRAVVAAGEPSLPDRELDDLFEVLWPKLETGLRSIPPAGDAPVYPLDHKSHEFVTQHALFVYHAEDLRGKLSAPIDDPDASNGRCRYANIHSLNDHIVYGPYEQLPSPGAYVAFFRLKIGRDAPEGPLVYLDVSGGGYMGRQLHRSSFTSPEAYDVLALPFRAQTREGMEYRVLPNAKRCQYWIDYVAVARAGDVSE